MVTVTVIVIAVVMFVGIVSVIVIAIVMCIGMVSAIAIVIVTVIGWMCCDGLYLSCLSGIFMGHV